MSSHLPLPAALLLALGCAHGPPAADVVWPDPPQVPRIRFERAVSSAASVETGWWRATLRALSGDRTGLRLQGPMGMAVSDDGQRLYVGDALARRVVRIDFARGELEDLAPDVPLGMPHGVALDGDESVYVVDSGRREIRVLSPRGKVLRAFGQGQLVRPTGVALDRQRRRLYVVDTATQASDRHGVVVFDADTGSVLRRLGDGVDPSSGGRGNAPGQFFFPTYVAVDARGSVYVADTLNFRIQVFTPEGDLERTLGEAGDGPGGFRRVKGLAFDGFGNLYAVDGGQALVQIFNDQGQLLLAFGGFAPHLLEYLDSAAAIAIHPGTNRIFVANGGTPRINVYQLVNTTAADSHAARPGR